MSKHEAVPYRGIYAEIRDTLLEARAHVYHAANSAMVQAYWQIGRIIVEHEQGGEEKAEYGKYLIKELSERLTSEFGKGFTEQNLRNMRQFYTTFPIRHTLCSELTWSHYRLLIRVKSEEARSFYADECVKAGWSVRQLERQINSFFYERLLSSRDKEAVSKEIFTKEPSGKPEDFIKDPYVLEFIGIKQDASVYEKDIYQTSRTNIVEHISHIYGFDSKNHDQEGRRRFCFCGRRRSRVEAMAPRAKEKNKVKIFYFVFFFAELDAWNPLARQGF